MEQCLTQSRCHARDHAPLQLPQQAIHVGVLRYCCNERSAKERKPAMSATVKVTSSIEDDLEPDVINVSVCIEGEAENKEQAAKAYNVALSSLLDALEEAGVRKEDVKSEYFRVFPVWKNQRRMGRYKYDSELSFKQPCTEERLDKVWSALASRGKGISFEFGYGLKDYEGAREAILRRAVDAGRKRAAFLADAAGCDLGNIVHIENDLRGSSYYGRSFSDAATGSGGSVLRESPVFNPESVSVSCEVTLEYELVARG